MEPSVRNRSQPVANGSSPRTAQTGRSATGGNHGNGFGARGKERVSFSAGRRNSVRGARTLVFAVNRAIGDESLGNADDLSAEGFKLHLYGLIFDPPGRFEHAGC
jgi:hypothetical protein